MRIRQLVAQLPLLFLGIAQVGAVHAQAKPDRWTLESAFSVKRVGTVAVSPNGQWAAVQVSEAIMDTGRREWQSAVHVFRVSSAGTHAAVRVDSQASSPAWSPDGRWLAFVSSRSGTRNIWRAPLDGGPAERLTDVSGELGDADSARRERPPRAAGAAINRDRINHPRTTIG